jgi:hypothetical protein
LVAQAEGRCGRDLFVRRGDHRRRRELVVDAGSRHHHAVCEGMVRVRAAIVCLVVVGCGGPMPGGVISSRHVQQDSLVDAAARARASGGWVAVTHVVDVSEVRQGERVSTGRPGVYVTEDEATFSLEVVDPLGGPLVVADVIEVTASMSPEYVVDAEGNERPEWTVTGGAPVEWQMPPTTGSFVVFTLGADAASQHVLLVAPVLGEEASGEHTARNELVPLADLQP